MKRVMVFGTFDILHKGHISFLKQAKRYGELIVVVARDVNVKKIKGKLPRYDEQQRFKKIASLDFVHSCFLGNLNNKYKLVDDLRPDVICLGYDQNSLNLENELVKRKLNSKLVRLKPYKADTYKSSKMLK